VEEDTSRAFANPATVVDGGCRSGEGARGFPDIESIAFGVQQAERVYGSGEAQKANGKLAPESVASRQLVRSVSSRNIHYVSSNLFQRGRRSHGLCRFDVEILSGGSRSPKNPSANNYSFCLVNDDDFTVQTVSKNVTPVETLVITLEVLLPTKQNDSTDFFRR